MRGEGGESDSREDTSERRPQPHNLMCFFQTTHPQHVTPQSCGLVYKSWGLWKCHEVPQVIQVIQVTLWSRQVCWRIGATAEVLMAHSPRHGDTLAPLPLQLCSSACHVTLQSWVLKELFKDFFTGVLIHSSFILIYFNNVYIVMSTRKMVNIALVQPFLAGCWDASWCGCGWDCVARAALLVS